MLVDSRLGVVFVYVRNYCMRDELYVDVDVGSSERACILYVHASELRIEALYLFKYIYVCTYRPLFVYVYLSLFLCARPAGSDELNCQCTKQ